MNGHVREYSAYRFFSRKGVPPPANSLKEESMAESKKEFEKQEVREVADFISALGTAIEAITKAPPPAPFDEGVTAEITFPGGEKVRLFVERLSPPRSDGTEEDGNG